MIVSGAIFRDWPMAEELPMGFQGRTRPARLQGKAGKRLWEPLGARLLAARGGALLPGVGRLDVRVPFAQASELLERKPLALPRLQAGGDREVGERDRVAHEEAAGFQVRLEHP